MQEIVEVFWNPTDRRLRAGWRVVVHFAVIFVGLQLVSAVILRPIASAVQGGDGSGPNPLLAMASQMMTVLPRKEAAGFLLFLVLFILVGAYEEPVFRGYQLKNIAEGFNFGRLSGRNAVFLGWIISSILFGLLHAANPRATAYTTFKITLGGLFLGLPLMLTGELALSIGIHVAWNFLQGNVFGFPVSGNTAMRTTIIRYCLGRPRPLDRRRIRVRGRIARLYRHDRRLAGRGLVCETHARHS